jgi:hypothetical protein
MLLAGCVGPRTADLDDLILRDSTYLVAETLEPFTGLVVRHFASDPEKVQLEGTLRDGTWEGELTVYHESGRIRYQGRLSAGTPCGAWVENRDDEAPGSVYRELKREIESMGLYPPCPER